MMNQVAKKWIAHKDWKRDPIQWIPSAMNCYIGSHQDEISKWKNKISITYWEKSYHLIGNIVGKFWIKKYNGIFTKSITWLQFQSRSIIGYYHLPTSTWPTQRTSTPILYGGLLFGRIFCMWWWDGTIELVYRSRPQTFCWSLSLTMQVRHHVYCGV